MGWHWRWRKVLAGGPFRLNLSKTGIGGSVGVPGIRTGISATGCKYIALGIPGTGLYWYYFFRSSKTPATAPANDPLNEKTSQGERTFGSSSGISGAGSPVSWTTRPA